MSSPLGSKSFFFILFLLFNYMHLINGFTLSPKFTVVIRNNLPNNSEKLSYRIQSGENDFGLRTLNVNEEFSFRFKWNYFGTTEFYCHFYWGSKYQIFDVFNNTSPCAHNYKNGLCLWVVKDSGFYLAADNPNPSPEDLHKRADWKSNMFNYKYYYLNENFNYLDMQRIYFCILISVTLIEGFAFPVRQLKLWWMKMNSKGHFPRLILHLVILIIGHPPSFVKINRSC